jgi:hypothetical protein
VYPLHEGDTDTFDIKFSSYISGDLQTFNFDLKLAEETGFIEMYTENNQAVKGIHAARLTVENEFADRKEGGEGGAEAGGLQAGPLAGLVVGVALVAGGVGFAIKNAMAAQRVKQLQNRLSVMEGKDAKTSSSL